MSEFMNAPEVEQTISTLRYLGDLGVVSKRDTYDNEYYIEDQATTYGRATDSSNVLELEKNAHRAIVDAELDNHTQGDYRLRFYAFSRINAWPMVSVEREGYKHTFGEKYSKRAAQIILNQVTKPLALLGHNRVEKLVAQAEAAQAARQRYEQSANQ
jgi:hypothetical protein